MAKKRKGKYPNLDVSQNLKSRTDYIESDYIDGVFNSKGEQLIRSLNEEEKAWLNKFYGEYIVNSDRQLNPTEETMDYMKQKSDCRKEIAKRKKEHKQNKRKISQDTRISFLESRIVEIEACLDFLREEQGVFHPTCKEHRELYNNNNTRNLCVFNNRKVRGMLLELTDETVDSFTATFWDTLSSFGYDSQDALIDLVEESLREQGFLSKDTESEDS